MKFFAPLQPKPSTVQIRFEKLCQAMETLQKLCQEIPQLLDQERKRAEFTINGLEQQRGECPAKDMAISGVEHYLAAVEALEVAFQNGFSEEDREYCQQCCAEGDRLLSCSEKQVESLKEECVLEFLNDVAA
jgi:hypothetical protein